MIVPAGTEREFLAPLSVSRLWGAGKKAQEKFRSHGIRTIGDVQQMGRDRLVAIFGTAGGAHFDHLSRGEDVRRVVPDYAAKSVSHERTFETDLTEEEACLDVMLSPDN